MRILMLWWELPPHNSDGLGTACLQLCKALSVREDVGVDCILSSRVIHGINSSKLSVLGLAI